MEIPKSTLMADIVARGPDHVLRLSMIYACLDASLKIQPDHIKAALKVWDYCKRSAAWIFGQYSGSRQADLLRWTLQRTPEGMTREQIIDEVFNRHIAGAKLDRVLSELVDAELIMWPWNRPKENRANAGNLSRHEPQKVKKHAKSARYCEVSFPFRDFSRLTSQYLANFAPFSTFGVTDEAIIS
jgi:hypothetical protein